MLAVRAEDNDLDRVVASRLVKSGVELVEHRCVLRVAAFRTIE